MFHFHNNIGKTQMIEHDTLFNFRHIKLIIVLFQTKLSTLSMDKSLTELIIDDLASEC